MTDVDHFFHRVLLVERLALDLLLHRVLRLVVVVVGGARRFLFHHFLDLCRLRQQRYKRPIVLQCILFESVRPQCGT